MKAPGLMQIFDSCPKDEVFLQAIMDGFEGVVLESVVQGHRIRIASDSQDAKRLAEAAFKAVKEVLLKALPVPYEGAV